MAKVEDVINLLDGYNKQIIAMNSSDSELRTKELALKASELSGGVNWGNGQKYIDKINDKFISIGLTAGTVQVLMAVIELNESIQEYKNYLQSSWWQFNGESKRSKNKISLPNIEELL